MPRKRGISFALDAAHGTQDDAHGISPRRMRNRHGIDAGSINGGTVAERHAQGAPGAQNKTRVANNAPRMDWPSTLQENGHKVNPGTHRGHGVQPSSQPSKPPTDTNKTEPKLTAQNSVQQSSHQAKPAKLNHGSTARFWVFLPSIPQFTRLGIRQAHHNLKRPSQSPQSNAPQKPANFSYDKMQMPIK